jgi:glucose/arabinose dehydrogenase
MNRTRIDVLLLAAALAAACTDRARLSDEQVFGTTPTIAVADPPLIPTLHVAPAGSWPPGTAPTAAAGLAVNAFAQGLDHPRGIFVLPNGDALVAEARAPKDRACKSGFKAWVERWAMWRAGAAGTSANRITLLRDADGDGVAEVRRPLIENLNSPFGMALLGPHLYVANTDALLRFPFSPRDDSVRAPGERVAPLPAEGGNCHWTRNVVAAPDGSHLLVAIGANSDHGERGPDLERGRAAVVEIDVSTGATRRFAGGLRNPVGLDWEPTTNTLWTAVNERDELGSDLVPDYMTAVLAGQDYGWPCRYFGEHRDQRVPAAWACESRPAAATPRYALGTHTAPLGLVFSRDHGIGKALGPGAFVALHGSWNRRPRSGYEVVFIPFREGNPVGMPVRILHGFLDPSGRALGRPVGVALDARGDLLVTDDVGGMVWRVSAKPQGSPAGSR